MYGRVEVRWPEGLCGAEGTGKGRQGNRGLWRLGAVGVGPGGVGSGGGGGGQRGAAHRRAWPAHLVAPLVGPRAPHPDLVLAEV